MNKNAYFEILIKEIKVLPKALQREILVDYNELFQEGLDSGKEEEEISRELGHPIDLVNSYIKQEMKSNDQQNIVVFDNLVGQVVLWVSLFIFVPINGWLFNKGYYGEVPKGIENITKMFGTALIIDPFFMTATVTAIIVLIKKLRNNTERMTVFTSRATMIERAFLTIIPLLLIVIYIFYHGVLRSLLIWMLFTPIVPVLMFKSSRKLTEKTIKTTTRPGK